MLYVELTLEVLRAVTLVVLGGIIWYAVRRIRSDKLLYKVMLIVGAIWAMIFVASLSDILDNPVLGVTGLTGLAQVLLEDGLFQLSILGVAYAIYRFTPTLVSLENTSEILRRHEGELIARERNEVRLREELNALHQIDLSSYEQVLRTVLERVSQTLGVSRVGIWLFTEDRKALVCEGLYDARAGEHYSGEKYLRADFPQYFKALYEYRVLRVIDVTKDVRTAEFRDTYIEGTGVQSLCAVSLDVPGVISGIICVEATDGLRNWSYDEVSFIRSVGDFMFLDYAREKLLESNQALEKTKAEFQAIADYTYSWELWLDHTGKALWVNSAVERITGYSVADALAMPDFPVCLADGADERKKFSDYIRSAARGDSADAMEVAIRDRNGNRLNLELSWQRATTSGALAEGARMSLRDVSERKRVEASLHEEENRRREAFTRLQTFLETTPTAIIQVDANDKIIDWNASAERVFGWSKAEVIGGSPAFMIPGYEDSEVRNWMLNNKGDADYMTCVTDNLRKDGDTIICEWHNSIIRDEDGATVSMFSIGQDITDQVRSRRRIENERQKFEDFSRSASDFFWETDAEGVITYASERLFHFIDATPEEFIGTRLQEYDVFFDDTNKSEALAFMDARQPFREVEIVGAKRVSGEPLYLSLSATPIFAEDGTFLGYRGTGRDIRDEMQQKAIERLIYMNVQGIVGEDYFGALVSNLVDVLDIDWAFIAEIDRSNAQKARVISGYGPDGEVVPFSFSLAGSASEITTQDGYNLFADNVTELFPDDIKLQKLGARGFGAIQLNDVHGQPIGLLILVSTNKLRDPEIVRHAMNVFSPRASAELGRKWSDQEREMLQGQFLHSQRMETMGKLAGGIAHDFNNVLTPILGYAEILVEDLEKDTRSHNDAAAILRGAKRARDLIDQILNFSRRADIVHSSVFDVARVIQNTVSFVSITLPANIRIRLSVSDTENTVFGDPSKLDQMVMNLITNAWHAIGEEDGQISVSVKQVHLTREAIAMKPPLQSQDNVEIVVKDDGCGISSDTLDRIFEPFFTTKGSGKGTGFGLSTVKGVVESMGGTIEASSRLGEGSSFTVLLPAATPQKTEEDEQAEVSVSGFAMASRLKSEKLNLLYVDDETENAEMASRMLEKLGHNVTVFDVPDDALAAFQEDPSHFDMMITDDSMPGMTGSVLSAEIMKLSPHLPVVVVSGGSRSMAAERYAPLGISTFVAKPFEANEIEAAIKSAAENTISSIMARI